MAISLGILTQHFQTHPFGFVLSQKASIPTSIYHPLAQSKQRNSSRLRCLPLNARPQNPEPGEARAARAARDMECRVVNSGKVEHVEPLLKVNAAFQLHRFLFKQQLFKYLSMSLWLQSIQSFMGCDLCVFFNFGLWLGHNIMSN